MKLKKLTTATLTLLLLAFGSMGFAEETTTEKVEATTNKAMDKVKETYRNSKNEICELINGEMKCAVKKVKNKLRTATDKTKTKTKEIKNKIDQ
jgi:hypothetical protein